jgi:hypothetical protein
MGVAAAIVWLTVRGECPQGAADCKGEKGGNDGCMNFYRGVTSTSPASCCCYVNNALVSDDECLLSAGTIKAGQCADPPAGCFGASAVCGGERITQVLDIGGRSEVHKFRKLYGLVLCVTRGEDKLCLTPEHYLENEAGKLVTMAEYCEARECERTHDRLVNFYNPNPGDRVSCAGLLVTQFSGDFPGLFKEGNRLQATAWRAMWPLNL